MIEKFFAYQKEKNVSLSLSVSRTHALTHGVIQEVDSIRKLYF